MRTSGVVIALTLCLLPRAALAQDALALVWSAPPSCPSRDEVVARVARLRPNLTRAASGLRATATVTPAPRGRWRVRLRTEVHGDVGERSLEGRTCALIADATAVVLALASDALPDAPPAADHPTLPESVVQLDDPESALPRPVVPPPPPSSPRRQLALGLDVAVDPIAFAGAAIALGLRGAFELGALRVELALAQQLPTTLSGAREGTGADVLATTLTARACAMRARTMVSVRLSGEGAVEATASTSSLRSRGSLRRRHRRWSLAVRIVMPNSQVRIDERPSNSLSRRCTTTQTSCAASSTWDSATPSRRRLRHTKGKCSR